VSATVVMSNYGWCRLLLTEIFTAHMLQAKHDGYRGHSLRSNALEK